MFHRAEAYADSNVRDPGRSSLSFSWYLKTTWVFRPPTCCTVVALNSENLSTLLHCCNSALVPSIRRFHLCVRSQHKSMSQQKCLLICTRWQDVAALTFIFRLKPIGAGPELIRLGWRAQALSSGQLRLVPTPIESMASIDWDQPCGREDTTTNLFLCKWSLHSRVNAPTNHLYLDRENTTKELDHRAKSLAVQDRCSSSSEEVEPLSL